MVAEQQACERQLADTIGKAFGGVHKTHQRARRPPYEGAIGPCKDRAEFLAGPSEDEEFARVQVAEDLGPHREPRDGGLST